MPEQLRFPSTDVNWRATAKSLVALLSAPDPVSFQETLDPLAFREASTATEIASLTALLRCQRTGDVARQAATALHQIALTNPVPQLREALPYLRRAWHIRFAHPELLQAMRAIEEATALWKDLPLPVEGDSERGSHNLPRPVE